MAVLNNQMVNYSWKNTENIWETINLGWFQGTCFLQPMIYIAGFSCRLSLKPTVGNHQTRFIACCLYCGMYCQQNTPIKWILWWACLEAENNSVSTLRVSTQFINTVYVYIYIHIHDVLQSQNLFQKIKERFLHFFARSSTGLQARPRRMCENFKLSAGSFWGTLMILQVSEYDFRSWFEGFRL